MSEVVLISLLAGVIYASDRNGPYASDASMQRAVEDACDLYDHIVAAIGNPVREFIPYRPEANNQN